MTEVPIHEPVDLRYDESTLADVHDRIVGFIDDSVTDAGADGVVIGLSGGIDSSLTATLAVEALGSDSVHGLVMPGAGTAAADTEDAIELASDLGMASDVIEIAPLADQFRAAFADEPDDQTVAGNLAARIRAVCCYRVANAQSRLVLGTGNRSEALVGYFTKYGDQAVDCNPIGNLYKTQIRQLARHLDLPDRIIEKKPTAGLWSGQTDEEELGISYAVLDAVLALHIDGGVPAAGTAALLDIDRSTVSHVRTLHRQSAHKRRLPGTPPESKETSTGL